MPSPKERSAAARARLLGAANELFYAEGVQSVGIDRVIERAGVAKATLYSVFGSKDGLVRAYLQARHAATAERMTRELETRYDTPKERLVGAFEAQGLSFTEPGFRGCAFISASADAPPGGVVEQAAQDYRTWLRELFFDLSQQAGRQGRQVTRPSTGTALRRRRDQRLAGPRPQRRNGGPHRSRHPGRRRHSGLNRPTWTAITDLRSHRRVSDDFEALVPRFTSTYLWRRDDR